MMFIQTFVTCYLAGFLSTFTFFLIFAALGNKLNKKD